MKVDYEEIDAYEKELKFGDRWHAPIAAFVIAVAAVAVLILIFS